MKRLLFYLFFFAGSLPSFLFAQDTGVSGTNLNFFSPSIDPYGFFGVNGPKLMKAGDFYFKISQDYAGPHIFQVSIGGTPTDVVDKISSTHFLSSVGINDFLTASLDIPFYLYAREANVVSLKSFTTQSLGDLQMAFKFRILEDHPDKPFPGLALLITNTFPAGNEMKFLGTSHAVPGVGLLAGKKFKDFSLAVNFGANFPQSKTVLGLKFDDQITYGGAIKIPFGFWDPKLSVMGEIRGHFEPNKIQIATAPVEFTTGLQKEFKNGLILQAAGGGAWNNAIGNPRIHALLTLSYSFSVKKISPEKQEIEQNPVWNLYFDFGSSQLNQKEETKLSEFLQKIKKREKIKKILVEGHTDSLGSKKSNLRLSRRRASTVKKILSQHFKKSTIETRGWGSKKPLSSNRTKEGRRLNRRVDILIERED